MAQHVKECAELRRQVDLLRAMDIQRAQAHASSAARVAEVEQQTKDMAASNAHMASRVAELEAHNAQLQQQAAKQADAAAAMGKELAASMRRGEGYCQLLHEGA